MRIAILDPFSGIAGDMLLGALVDVGLDEAWLRALPARLGLDGVTVRIERVQRSHIGAVKVDFDIPPQPHGRHLRQIRAIVAAAEGIPARVRELADAAFTAIATVEGEIHGVSPDRVHLHEVGAVDAILDVVGGIWGLELLGVERVYCGPIAMGDGTVKAAHGELPVPAPATMRLLEGLPVRSGPPGSGELVTPTGAALVRVLAAGPAPAEYTPRRSGYGAGTRDPHGRPNALRLVLADEAATPAGRADRPSEHLVQIVADLDDMDAEVLSAVAESMRADALDVVLIPTIMKKGRPGVRVEILASQQAADALEDRLLSETSTIGVRRFAVERRALVRETRVVRVLDREVRVKVVTAPDGRRRAKPELADLQRVARDVGRPLRDVSLAARLAAEQMLLEEVDSSFGAAPEPALASARETPGEPR